MVQEQSQGQGWDLNTLPCPFESNALTSISSCVMSEGYVKGASVISDSSTDLQFSGLPADPGSWTPSLSAPLFLYLHVRLSGAGRVGSTDDYFHEAEKQARILRCKPLPSTLLGSLSLPEDAVRPQTGPHMLRH